MIQELVLSAMMSYHLAPASDEEGRYVGTEIFLLYPSEGPTEKVCLYEADHESDTYIDMVCFKPSHPVGQLYTWVGKFFLTDGSYLVFEAAVRMPDGRLKVIVAYPANERPS